MELIFKDLSENIIKCAFRVFNTLGYGYLEKEYQKSLELELKKLGLKFVRELYSNLYYEGVKIRGFYIDFVVEDSVVVELKVASSIQRKHYSQTFQYLKNNNLKLGLILIFSPTGVIIKRVVNLK